MPSHRQRQQRNVSRRNKKEPRLGLLHLPFELINMILDEIDYINDLSSFSQVNRALLEAYQYSVFADVADWRTVMDGEIDVILDLFYHGVRHDSVRIVTILTHYVRDMEIKGYMPTEPFKTRRITYFHHALIADAPKVSAYLAAAGEDMFDESFEFYPSMAAIHHALFPQTVATQWELNKALRVACNYGLSRTAYVLLERGADPMDTSPFGLMPIHLALTNRQPWWDSGKYDSSRLRNFQLRPKVHHLDWEELARWNISALLKFGCPLDLRSAQMRRHKCDHKCLGSLDCDHHEQTPLHMAAKIDFANVTEYLLNKGADPYTPNGEGYTPLYCAIVHGSSTAAGVLFRRCQPVVNPIVHIPTGTTALHIACRFALPSMVDWLLEAGAAPNVINNQGLSPLHEVLCQTQPDRSRQVYLVLKSLARFNANPATPSCAPKTPWEMARNHPFPDVQEMFADRTLMTFWELDQLSGGKTSAPRKGRRQRKRGNQGIKRADKQAPWQTVATSPPIEPEFPPTRVDCGRETPDPWTDNDALNDNDPCTRICPLDPKSAWGDEWLDNNWYGGEREYDEMKALTPDTRAEDNFVDFGEDLVAFDTNTPIKPFPPKLLTLNNLPAKPKSNASLFPELESRDAAKKAASEDASTSPQGTKKVQSRNK
ncbi:hypothetical protein PpBr36_03112 [Pyricularia pennisetigena]|uniref:hypothetical protein n=1 Tax=Pyricularia pennisetigena TaxID=1578925 RepID=UPI001152B318|nr:hypothetical protein PpBr36_03112 [Pyricularia pennisetigena]TLS31536.1 hypothetical protein PpBr36_03112 [Pyricularia pennisetigena]